MKTLDEFCEAAVTHLRATLPAKLAAIDAEYGDLELDAPADDGGDVGDVGVSYSYGDVDVLAYPWVEVAAPDYTITDLSIGQWTANWQPIIVVLARYLHTDRRILRKAVMRYNRALLELLLEQGAFGAGEAVQEVRGSNRFNPEANERDEVYGVALLVFTLDGEGAGVR